MLPLTWVVLVTRPKGQPPRGNPALACDDPAAPEGIRTPGLLIAADAPTPALGAALADAGRPAEHDRRLDRVPQVMVTDLDHLLDLPADAPGPARRLAEHLGTIVRAATAGDAGPAWETALPCRRRPAHHPCPGRMIVLRTEAGTPISWQCSSCPDAGVISNWEDSPFDLRRRRLTITGPALDHVIANETAAALRDLQLLDPDCERLVFRIRGQHDRAILSATEDDLEELIGAVAAEANHEPNRGRQRRLDAAFDALNQAAAGRG
jgi:hypothetical protein